MIKKIPLKTAGLINIAVNAIGIVIHLLVIFQIMPFTWINGGRTLTFELARQTSVVSIIIFLLLSPITLLACGIIPCKFDKLLKTVLSIYLWLSVAAGFYSLLLQLAGTRFEKLVTSVLVFINIIMGVRMAIEKR